MVSKQWVQCRMVLVVNFCVFEIIIFGFAVAICDLVHDAEAMYMAHVSC